MKVASLLLLLSSQALASTFSSLFDYSKEWDEAISIDRSHRRHRENSEGSIVDRLREEKRFSKFVDALAKDRNLRDDLESKDKRSTVFAPTNDAFQHLEDHKHEYDRDWDLSDILRYHILDQEVKSKDLHSGRIVKTDLKLKSLDDKHQIIRAFEIHGHVWLNLKARVEEADLKADNGLIHAIDRILIPPPEAYEVMWMVPTEFSTMIAAAERTGLNKKLEDEKAITVFVPNNDAWESLGYENLAYLFGTKKGNDDLKKIMQYHVGTELVYTTHMMKEGKLKIRTLHKDEDLTVEAIDRKGKHDDRRKTDDRRRRNDDRRRDAEEDVRDFFFVLNRGEANIKFADGPAENGVLHMINEVLVPEDVKLPHHH